MIIGGTLIALGWAAYIAASGYVLFLIFTGTAAPLIKDYMFGTASAWICMGLILWGATEWFDEEFGEK
jgi:hypothetical protein